MENRGGGHGRLDHVILLHKQYNLRGLSNYRGATETNSRQEAGPNSCTWNKTSTGWLGLV